MTNKKSSSSSCCPSKSEIEQFYQLQKIFGTDLSTHTFTSDSNGTSKAKVKK